MAPEVTIDGRAYRLVRPIAVFALSVVTLGIYWLVWYYRTNDDIRMYLRNYTIRPPREAGETAWTRVPTGAVTRNGRSTPPLSGISGSSVNR